MASLQQQQHLAATETMQAKMAEMQAGFEAQHTALEELRAMEMESDSESAASQRPDAPTTAKNPAAKRTAIAGRRRLVLATAIGKKTRSGIAG